MPALAPVGVKATRLCRFESPRRSGRLAYQSSWEAVWPAARLTARLAVWTLHPHEPALAPAVACLWTVDFVTFHCSTSRWKAAQVCSPITDSRPVVRSPRWQRRMHPHKGEMAEIGFVNSVKFGPSCGKCGNASCRCARALRRVAYLDSRHPSREKSTAKVDFRSPTPEAWRAPAGAAKLFCCLKLIVVCLRRVQSPIRAVSN